MNVVKLSFKQSFINRVIEEYNNLRSETWSFYSENSPIKYNKAPLPTWFITKKDTIDFSVKGNSPSLVIGEDELVLEYSFNAIFYIKSEDQTKDKEIKWDATLSANCKWDNLIYGIQLLFYGTFGNGSVFRNIIEINLTNNEVYPNASAKARYENEHGIAKLTAEVENIPNGNYYLYIDNSFIKKMETTPHNGNYKAYVVLTDIKPFDKLIEVKNEEAYPLTVKTTKIVPGLAGPLGDLFNTILTLILSDTLKKNIKVIRKIKLEKIESAHIIVNKPMFVNDNKLLLIDGSVEER